MKSENKTGMFGIWSLAQKRFIFGIQEPTKSKAWKALKKEIGWHGAKYGNFKAKPISINHTEHLGNGLGAEIKRM
ncbi:hypothetical protein ACUXCC_002940 [Cytobacillus horneckiae]|uniref:hypothetical protein n=1 Tax=Cytobacillus horneckiae TaxID=549687 RepID=UPI0019D0C6DE|nr:hypothetical protein [Cytobacillus horneckiae]MBN6887758.1 hypothetical protein [Cytobacillus horneckiae]MED2940676.1 hypothetical protein [Cytobacillus horneckiae]